MTEALTLEHAALLGRVQLFAELDRLTVAQLATHVDAIPVEDGVAVVERGEEGGDLYIVSRGTFGVFAASAHEPDGWTRLGSLTAGDYFGEMALITGETRSATVRAEGTGEVLRLERDRFIDLVRKDPSIGLAIAVALTRRIQARDQLLIQSDHLVAEQVQGQLERLDPSLRRQVLEASILPQPSAPVLQTLFGQMADEVATQLRRLGPGSLPLPHPVQRVLGQLFERDYGAAYVQSFAGRAARQLADHDCWDEALTLAAQQLPRAELMNLLGEALRESAPSSGRMLMHWVEQFSDEEALQDAELAIARARLHEEWGEPLAAEQLMRRALERSVLVADGEGGGHLTEALTRFATEDPDRAPMGVRWSRLTSWRPHSGVRAPLALGCALALAILAAFATASAVPAGHYWGFMLLFGASIALSQSNLFADYVVALALVAAWMVFDLARPEQAIAGFASLDWLFVLAVLALAAAVAHSGLLFRVGLLFIQRMPPRLLPQAGTLFLTGVLLSPLLPENRGRAALTTPFALSVAQAQRLRDRDPAAALLGLSAWIGADPLMFLFLNGSPLCLLAWGLLPIESRARFDWFQWLIAALPLGIMVSVGTLLVLYLLLRPRVPMSAARERVRVQLAVLGPPTAREHAMIGVLVLTVAGWFFAPALHLEVGTIAILGLLAAIVTGNFDQRSLRELDWGYLIFYGVALSTAALRSSFGTNGDFLLGLLGHFGAGFFPQANGLLFVLVVAALHTLVRLAIHQNQAILLLGIALIPIAPSLGVDPWIVVITLLATSSFWFLRTQTPGYLVAYTSSEGRLFSHDQARLAGFGYAIVVLLSLICSVPYWHWLGLL